ncbi:hypothetical protein R1flu_005054 [Riccia fluitans]|uniref:non-specific serine/threonine protein kinase n=1 Tax=Riccia fluitans TaxID=41844 RepID=A0ABD1YS23_9MARC
MDFSGVSTSNACGIRKSSTKFLRMQNYRRSTGAILCLILLFQQQLDSAYCSRAEAWTSSSRKLIATEAGTALNGDDDLCPLNFDRLSQYPWAAETCQKWPPEEYVNSTLCCNAVVSAFWLAEAQLLNETNKYRLPNMPTVNSCLQKLQKKLKSQGLTHQVVNQCFPESLSPRFLTNNSLCLGIATGSDFEGLIGVDDIKKLRLACAGDLIDPLACSKCQTGIISVYNILNTYPRNSTEVGMAYEKLIGNITIGSNLDGRLIPDCFYDVLLYTAAKGTSYGVWSETTANCVLAVKLKEKPSSPTVTDMILISLALSLCSSLLGWVIVFFILFKRRRKRFTNREDKAVKPVDPLQRPIIGLIEYDYREIQTATSNFSTENLIGEGKLGSVYKGVMEGLQVAVKRINNVTEQEDVHFLNEVRILNMMRHPNLVFLRGYGLVGSCDGEVPGHHHRTRLLVYDFVPNGSLEKFLYQPKGDSEEIISRSLSWANRVKIIVGVAKGLAYLHEETQPSLTHSDIRPANILLDQELNPRLAEFGLARLSDGTDSQYWTSGRRGGAPGYVAPEYALYGQFTEKSDVYSFGVIMLELLTGRKPLDPSKESTPEYAVTEWSASMVMEGKVWEVVDERIRFVGPKERMQTYVMIACMCTQKMVTLRPTFREVLKYLQGQLPVPTIMLPVHQYSFYDWPEVESFTASTRFSISDTAILTQLLR